jgi:hypothetical protein
MAVIRACPRSPDLVCLGSSRIGTAFREEVIQDAIRAATGDQDFAVLNAAIESADLPTADALLERILHAGLRPAMVVIEVSPETLADRNYWLRNGIQRFWTWRDVATSLGDVCRSQAFCTMVKCRLLPLHAYRQDIRREAHRWLVAQQAGTVQSTVAPAWPSTALPWREMLQAYPQDPRPPIDRTPKVVPFMRGWLTGYRIRGSASQALESAIGRCQQNGIAVVLVSTPLLSDHCRLYTPEIETAFHEHMHQVAHARGCRFVDCRRQLPDTMFYDHHHVLLEGAEAFSRRLVIETLAPLWLAEQRTKGCVGEEVRPTSYTEEHPRSAEARGGSATTAPNWPVGSGVLR